MSSGGSGWSTLESDPGIFSALLTSFGVSGLQAEELWSLDNDALPSEVHGLLFLFKWRSAKERRADASAAAAAGASAAGGGTCPAPPPLPSPPPAQPWFAQQTISNACGTQALLHVVLNLEEGPSTGIALGPTLSTFKDFTGGLDAATRGGCFDECVAIRDAHNAFARPEPFLEVSRKPRDTDEAPNHYVAYVPAGGSVWELDGLAASGPRYLGPAGAGGAWVGPARAALQARIAEYSAGETAFNLIALVPCRQACMRARAGALASAAEDAYGSLLSLGGGSDAPPPDALFARLGFSPGEPTHAATTAVAAALAAAELPGAPPDAAAAARYAAISDEVGTLAVQWAAEADQREAWRLENAKRQTNWVPFIFAALTGLAERGDLDAWLEAGVARQAAAKERARKEGRKG